jgi:hypothetical protein
MHLNFLNLVALWSLSLLVVDPSLVSVRLIKHQVSSLLFPIRVLGGIVAFNISSRVRFGRGCRLVLLGLEILGLVKGKDS